MLQQCKQRKDKTTFVSHKKQGYYKGQYNKVEILGSTREKPVFGGLRTTKGQTRLRGCSAFVIRLLGKYHI